MKSLLDPSFEYVSSANTDLHKTFARARKIIAAANAWWEAEQAVLKGMPEKSGLVRWDDGVAQLARDRRRSNAFAATR